MISRQSITAAIIARDAADHLPHCLRSVSWCDQSLVVVDDRTTDRTAQIARDNGAHVVVRQFENWAAQRNAALSHCATDWTLFVDADERVTRTLSDEIVSVLEYHRQEDGFWIPRVNLICGRWVRHGGWYPDYQLRLLRRERTRYDPDKPVHEVVLFDGESGYLTQPLLHHNYHSVAEIVSKQENYAPYDAARLRDQGKIKPRTLLGGPAREFYRRYIRLGGALDGPIGIMLALILAGYELRVRLLALAQSE